MVKNENLYVYCVKKILQILVDCDLYFFLLIYIEGNYLYEDQQKFKMKVKQID